MLYSKRIGRFFERLANPDEQALAPKGVLLYSPSLLRLVAGVCYAIWFLGFINNFFISDFFRRSYSEAQVQGLFYSQLVLVIIGGLGTGFVIYFARTRYRFGMLFSSMLAVTSGMLASVFMYGLNVNPHMLLAITPLLLIGFTVGRDGLVITFLWIVANYLVLYFLDQLNLWPRPNTISIDVVRHENLSAFIILILIVLAVEFYVVKIAVTLRRQGELHQALEKEQQERLDLLSRLIATQDQERQHLAHILHEGPVQDLAAVRAGIWNQMDSKELVRIVDQTIDKLRTVSHDLHPANLELYGLPTALNHLAQRQGQDANIAIDVKCPGSLCCDKRVERVLYRIAQEALINARKHSGARRVSVSVAESNGAITLEVRDDGHGFDVESAQRKAVAANHFGLVSLRELAASVEGKLDILSSARAGTTVRVAVPIGPSPAESTMGTMEQHEEGV